MIIRILIFTVLFLPEISFCSENDELDTKWRRLIIGSWSTPFFEKLPALKECYYRYNEDFTFTSFAKLNLSGLEKWIFISGEWHIKDGTYIEKITKTSVPKIVPLGLSTTDKIVQISATEFRFIDKNGYARNRIKMNHPLEIVPPSPNKD